MDVRDSDVCRIYQIGVGFSCELLNTLLWACDGLRALDWARVGKCTDLHRHHRWQTKLDLPEAYLSRVWNLTGSGSTQLSDR